MPMIRRENKDKVVMNVRNTIEGRNPQKERGKEAIAGNKIVKIEKGGWTTYTLCKNYG